ncbi:MAG: XrtA/PEP-CTERM system histidine kinase PrsK [Nitrospirota bacterium]
MNILSSISIITSIVIALFVFSKNKKGIPNIAFALGMISIGVIEFGDTMTLREPYNILFYKKISLIGESLLPVLWLLFSFTYSRKVYKEISIFWKAVLFISILPFLFAISLPLNLFLYAPDIETEGMIFLNTTGYYFYLFIIMYSILTLINLEGTLRAASGSIRWRIKHMLIGTGGIMALLVYYYSHALLYRSIDMNLLHVRESVVIISSIFIMISVFREAFPKEEISVSKGIFYKSFALLVTGAYLLGLGIMGTGMKYLGEDFGRYSAITIVFAGTIAFIAVLFSETLRRRVKVFIDKNFYKDKYDYRRQWLQFTQRLSSTKSFDELLSAVLEVFASAMGSKTKSLWLYNKSSDEFYQAQPPSNRNLKLKGNSSLILYFKEKGWVFNSKEKNLTILEENREFFERTNALLVVPLQNNGDIIGFIELGEALSNDIYTYEDYDFLKTLARQATSAIMNAKLAEYLAEAREMEALGTISSFIIHDLKNLVSALSMSVENAPDNINNPEFQKDMLKTLSTTTEKMRILIKRLSEMPEKVELKLETVDIAPFVKETVTPFLNGKTDIAIESPDRVPLRIDREEIKKVIINLLLNAIEAANGKEPKIKIRMGKDHNTAYITISDNGCGMSEEFIERHLFKPFRTTKKKGFGIGLYQCRSIIEAHGGSIKVQSKVNAGSDFTVYLPLE